jgi:hypothetical protein
VSVVEEKMLWIAIFLSLLLLGECYLYPFEFGFPRNGEIFLPTNDCNLQLNCQFQIYYFGWFQKDFESYEMPLELKTRFQSEIKGNVVITELKFGKVIDDSSTNLYINITALPLILKLEAKLFDANYQVLSDILYEIILVSPIDYQRTKILNPGTFQDINNNNKNLSSRNFLQTMTINFLENSQQFFESGKGTGDNQNNDNNKAKLKRKLDFIEIGTSDYDTCIQQVDQEYQMGTSSYQYFGISIEAMTAYINKLPHVPHVLKLNTAITPSSQPDNEFHSDPLQENKVLWNPIYSLPEFLVSPETGILPDNLRGTSMMFRINPFIAAKLIPLSLSPILIQKEYVPSISISSLLPMIHSYFEKGINLLKIDIEGLDQQIVGEVLSYYRHFYPSKKNETGSEINSQWPCVIVFESLHFDSIRSETLVTALRSSGYRFPHEVVLLLEQHFPQEWIFRAFIENTIAMNCECSFQETEIAWKFVYGAEVTISQDFFGEICQTEQLQWKKVIYSSRESTTKRLL